MRKLLILLGIMLGPYKTGDGVIMSYSGDYDIVAKILQSKMRTVTMTAYTPSKDETDETPFITANGETIKFGNGKFSGTIAVSRDLFKQGYRFGDSVLLYQDSILGVFKINDLMHRRWKNRIDICVNDKKMAYQIGKQRVKILKL